MRIITYNIRTGRGIDNERSLSRVADVIRATEADVACLQEVDQRMPGSRFVDQARWLGKHLGMTSVYQRNFNMGFGGMGNLILSRHPVLESNSYALTSKLEQRGLLAARIALPEGVVNVFCTHWGLSSEDRSVQSSETAVILNATEGPKILCGDFNETHDKPAVYALINAANLHDLAADTGAPEPTFPSHNPKVRIDLIFASPDVEAVSASFISSPASDHRPVLVEARVIH